jgi:nucleotide-binding universal stress UspA family protein
MYKRVVVPLDGSELAELALPHAVELARVSGAGIHLIRVVDLTSGQPYGAYLAFEAAGYAEAANLEESESREYLSATRRQLEARGFRVTTETRRGPASHEVNQVVQPDDVVVMATHGRGGLRRWLLGSVAEEVVRHSPVPVLLVRADHPVETAAAPGGPVAAATHFESW